MADILEVFATKKSLTRLSDLPPMRVLLKDEIKSFIQKPRNLGPIKVEALRKKLVDLLRIGKLKSDDDPRFGSAIFMVPKSNYK